MARKTTRTAGKRATVRVKAGKGATKARGGRGGGRGGGGGKSSGTT